ncbi:polysaccharide biosynthesis/export family protein [Terrarubrum flagellatum]|uniref:polysaccharide biosynthesis/export family protein n=1 Tax=Terrirubrum flagellatum TaxID=2895980 RepID=UPI0031450FE3
MLTRRFTLLACAAGLLVSACAPRAPYAVALIDENPLNDYRLASGDKLRVIVFGQDSLSNIYGVDAQGRISMPLIGDVPAMGRTTRELERQIEARLRGGYLREPRVSVEVDAYRPFFVLGEVNSSGQFPYVVGMTAQTAVAIAGGFSPRAYQSSAEITRMIEGAPVTGTVPITTPIRPGDTIVIRERWL